MVEGMVDVDGIDVRLRVGKQLGVWDPFYSCRSGMSPGVSIRFGVRTRLRWCKAFGLEIFGQTDCTLRSCMQLFGAPFLHQKQNNCNSAQIYDQFHS